MRRIGLATIGLFLFHHTATAQTWSAISITATPENVPQVIAATDALMNSAAGKDFPGKLLFEVEVADGADPATHTFIPIYKTAAQREAFVQKLQADPAWNDFMAAMTKLSQPVSTILYRVVKSWGDIVDTDHVWMGYAFHVTDEAGFLAAMEKLMASPTGKKFPGQVYLSEVTAGGISPVTHLISVGYASEAEMETWNNSLTGSADWAAYLKASRKAGDYLGGSLSRDLKSWGSATLKSLASH